MNRTWTIRLTAIARKGFWAATAAAGVVGLSAGEAYAALPQPKLDVTQQALPTHIRPGGTGAFRIAVENIGNVATDQPVTLENVLPPGLTSTGVTAFGDESNGIWDCPGAVGATTIRCTLVIGNFITFGPEIPAHLAAPDLNIFVRADPSASGTAENVVTVSGGGASGDDTSTGPAIIDATPATFGIAGFGGRVLNNDGSKATQAGAHSDFTTEIAFNTAGGSGADLTVADNVSDISVDLPPGVVGNPQAAPTCSPTDIGDVLQGAQCRPETQVGTASVVIAKSATEVLSYPTVGVYNVDAPAGLPARFAFNIAGVVVNIDPTIRADGGYGIRANIRGISQSLPVVSTRLTLWGVPADPSHDSLRVKPDPFGGAVGIPSTDTRKPFMTAPTSCNDRSLVTRMTASSWQHPSDVKSASFDTDFDGQPFFARNCELLAFQPGFVVRPESAAKRGAPAGIGVDLTIPQNDNPDGLATANLKQAVVTLPLGMSVNPSSADGLQACTPGQIGIGNDNDPTCPSGSKIGSIDIDTPLLRDPLRGSIYFAAQRDNPFGTTLAIYLVAKGTGVTIKLPGRIDTNGRTVTATFDNNPQLPFEKLSLHFKTGPRAPLSLPRTCGPATTTAVLTPWSGTPPVTIQTSFDVSYDGNGAPCPAMGFNPTFSAGTVNPVGGKDSPFVVGFSRTDDDQELGGVTVNMPRGLLARIASVNLCSDGQAAAGTCGDDSKIGSVTTAAGAGSNPFTLPGRVYISGPYKGAPFGLSIVVPAVAGPLNLGTVVVRAAIFVDRNTAELRIVSDPLPSELEGIPLQVRLVEVKVDRPGFTFNPTNCSASRVGGQISSLQGAIANVASRFQVGNCSALPFTPKMTLKAGARGKLTRGKRTPLDVTLTMTRGLANNRSVQVTLPLAMNARLDVVNKRRACTQAQYDVDKCPMSVGTGTAVTPLLRDPLKGNAYFVYNPARRLPDLVIRLRGQVDFDLVGKVTITRDLRLQTTFDAVPDVPITKFRLQLASGPRNGPVGFTRNACAASTRRVLKAQLAFVAQNSKRVSRTQTIQVVGCGKARARARARARGKK